MEMNRLEVGQDDRRFLVQVRAGHGWADGFVTT